MLEFVERLTLAPWDVSEADRHALERRGWHPLETLQIVLGCAHFNYLNRMADGLGIAFEYATGIERFEKGGGEVRRRELRDGRASPHPVGSNGPTGGAGADSSRPLGLARLLAFHPALATGIAKWREFQLRGTEVLTAPIRARIALFAAAVEWCDSALGDAEVAAAEAGVPAEERARLASGEIAPDESPRIRRLLEHTKKLSTAPASMTEADVIELRAHGLDDREIVRLTMLVSYLAFEHRVRFGLRGVSASPDSKSGSSARAVTDPEAPGSSCAC